MADGTVDRLEIEVQTQAQKANAELEKLVGKLDRVSGSLSKINASGLKGLANGIQSLSVSMQNMSNIKTVDFSRLTKNIEKLGSIDQSKINATASAIRTISSSLTASTGLTSGATQITDLANSISKLGYKSASNAITNIPLMAEAIKGLMQTLSTSPDVSKNLIDMTNAIGNLANQGSKVRSATNSINGSLKKYSSSTKQASVNTKSFAFSLAGLYAKLWLVRRAVTEVWGSIEKSMNFGNCQFVSDFI
jgi:methyl-accepting chemotaxis protein